MLEELFLQIVNKSFVAGIVILIILAARVPLKKAPRKFAYLLWAVALFRLAVPFSFESAMSLLPVNPAPVSGALLKASVPRIQTGMAAVDHSVNGLLPQAEAAVSVNPLQVWAFIGSVVWLLGMAALLIHGAGSLVRMKKSLEAASWEKDNIYHSETVETPFVLGLFRPKIYLPASLSESERAYILLHEQTHIKRFDHVVRFIGYLTVCVHWFNPLAWLAYHLSGRDMEMSCDEAVLGQLGHGVKQAYSQSLLNLATGRRRFALTPLAFGEGDTKGRITNVLNLKQPRVYMIVAAVIVLTVAVIGLSTDPKQEPLYGNDAESITEKIKSIDLYEGKAVEILEIKDYDEDRLVAFLSDGDPSLIEFEKDGGGNYVYLRSETHGDQPLSQFVVGHIGNADAVVVASIKNKQSDTMEFSFKANEKIYEVNFEKDGADVQWTDLGQSEGGFRFEWDYIDGDLNTNDSSASDLWIQNPYLTHEIETGNWTIIDNTSPWESSTEMEGASPSGTEIKRIVDEKLDRIMSSPRESSNTHDYIEAHYEDYRDIVALGEEALDYLVETVESGDETGLRGAIMRELIREFQDRQIGYISGFEASGTPRVTFDPVEWITLEDGDRIEALGIEDVEMPNGYYIHNPVTEALEYEVSEAAEYRFINWGNAFGGGEQDSFHYSTTDRQQFSDYLDTYSDRAVTVPFWITVREGVVQKIEEQYVP